MVGVSRGARGRPLPRRAAAWPFVDSKAKRDEAVFCFIPFCLFSCLGDFGQSGKERRRFCASRRLHRLEAIAVFAAQNAVHRGRCGVRLRPGRDARVVRESRDGRGIRRPLRGANEGGRGLGAADRHGRAERAVRITVQDTAVRRGGDRLPGPRPECCFIIGRTPFDKKWPFSTLY